MNVLFLCTGNSCRSIMAEAIFRKFTKNGFFVQSAGSKPTGFVHTKALETLIKNNISTEGLTSKSWDNLSMQPDIVITLCASAHGETCPAYIGKVVRCHWGMDDPAHAKNQDQAFDDCYKLLLTRIQKFFSLPFNELGNNDEKLKQSLNSIASY